jgi:hypothetical protein
MWRSKFCVAPSGPAADTDQADWSQINAPLLEKVMCDLRSKGNSSSATLKVSHICVHAAMTAALSGAGLASQQLYQGISYMHL